MGLRTLKFFAHDPAAGGVRAELGQTFDAPYLTRETASGRHVAVTIEPWIDSPEQVLAIYARLRQEAGLLFLF